MRQEQSCESVLFVSISLVCVHMAVRVCDCTLTSSAGLVVGERERERERERGGEREGERERERERATSGSSHPLSSVGQATQFQW